MPTKAGAAVAHRADVERLLDPPDERLGERGAPAGDLIEVAACDGVVAGVKAMRTLIDATGCGCRPAARR